MTVARVAGIVLIALGVAYWPGTPLIGMLTYSVAVTVYLAYLGLSGGLTGILLWPVVRRITSPTKGLSIEQVFEKLNPLLRGWLNYFGCCDTPSIFKRLGE